MTTLLLIPLMIGCATVAGPAPVSGGDAAEAADSTGTPPVSFAPLEERVNVLLAESQETDRRDRLMVARELMEGMRNKEVAAQRKVYAYLEQVLKIEERSRPASIHMDPIGVPIEEESLGGPSAPVTPRPGVAPGVMPGVDPAFGATDPGSVVVSARAALAESRYLDAVSALQGVATPEAATLRKEAIDGWARTERERAGHMFLEARQLPPGGERIASLRAARSALSAINERFPQNAYAAQITENIAKVDADLAAVGARP